MTEVILSADQLTEIDVLVAHFQSHRDQFVNFGKTLRLIADDPALSKYVHSVKWRVKDPAHLRDKLQRKYRKCLTNGRPFELTTANLFERINDLVGLRILHLYTRQFALINTALLEALAEQMYNVLEGPFARYWDSEYRDYFNGLGVKTEESKRMYTSVHYVIQANRRTMRTAEIQVRTLAEEIWGEVDHTINYPLESDKLACREQIKVLAKVASSCGRLVDSIFLTHEEGRTEGTSVDEPSIPTLDLPEER